jgi:hypothetical protein
MTRFRDLLRFDPTLSPAEEQARASRNLPEAVAQSSLGSEAGRTTPHQGKYLLVVVAPYSHADLTFLDLIDEHLASSGKPAIPVYVHDVLEYSNVVALDADFPGILSANPTPLAALWEDGWPLRVESGKRARDMIAEVLGLDGGLADVPKKMTLDDLLAGITDENMQAKVDFGPPVGKEVL